MSDRIFWKSATSLLTSASLYPEPEAMRRRRLGELDNKSGSEYRLRAYFRTDQERT